MTTEGELIGRARQDAAPEGRIPFNRPGIEGHELDYIRQAVEHGHTSADGPFTARAAELLRDELGAHQVLLTTSCTAALEMSAMLLDVGPGDTVVVPSFGFVTTALAYARQGARIAFCDIERRTLGLDPEHLASLMDDSVRAVVPIHYSGVACDLDRIEQGTFEIAAESWGQSDAFILLTVAGPIVNYPKYDDEEVTGWLFEAWATLDELAEADLLLHVIDVTSGQFEEQMAAVETILEELDIADKPQLRVFNKADRFEDKEQLAALCRRFSAAGVDAVRIRPRRRYACARSAFSRPSNPARRTVTPTVSSVSGTDSRSIPSR